MHHRPILAAAIVLSCSGVAAQAVAQGIVGHWVGNGMTAQGAPFVEELTFLPNGQLRLQLSIAAGANSGITRCIGQYGFDGTNLQSRVDACQICSSYGCNPAPPQLSSTLAVNGPVQFTRDLFMEFGGLRFSRQ